jgi:hypothetical protein
MWRSLLKLPYARECESQSPTTQGRLTVYMMSTVSARTVAFLRDVIMWGWDLVGRGKKGRGGYLVSISN